LVDKRPLRKDVTLLEGLFLKFKIMKRTCILFFIISSVATFLFSQENKKIISDFQLEVEAENRYFYETAGFIGQKNYFPSLSIKPEYSMEWNEGREFLNFTGFFRVDKDDERTHFDIRELYYQKVKNKLEFSIGLKKIFWGVTESNHLVDIINQTDIVESFDGEKKLGQPMVQLSYSSKIGTFDMFYLPYFRKRTFSGVKSRLRFPNIIDTNDVRFESRAEEWHQDIALRWSHSFSIFDIGISHFYGTGREPVFNFTQTGIDIVYPIINQTGLDAQITHNAFLWKAETIYRTNDFQKFFALTAGLEYTISNIKNTGIDVGILAEYLYDERDEFTLNSLQNDLFLGSRIAFNDIKSTQILLGSMLDVTNQSKIFSLEASRRIGNTIKIELESRLFSTISTNELILANFSEDSFFRISVFKFF